MEKLIKSDNGQWTLVKADDEADTKKGQRPPPIMLTDRAERKDQSQRAMPAHLEQKFHDEVKRRQDKEMELREQEAKQKKTQPKELSSKDQKNIRQRSLEPAARDAVSQNKEVREKGAGYKMTRGVGDMMQQLHEEGQMKGPPPSDKLKAHIKEAAKVSKIPVSQGKTVKEREHLAQLKDKGRRIVEAASRSKYFTKPEQPEKEDKVIRRKKEDMAKALDGMIYNLNKALEEDHDSEMLFSQLEAIMHHIKEIREVMTPEEDAPDWIDAKITEAAKNLSDVAHYIQGEKAKK